VTEEDALQEILLLWKTRERRHAEILAAVHQAEWILRPSPRAITKGRQSP
jgi:hypothetical protein